MKITLCRSVPECSHLFCLFVPLLLCLSISLHTFRWVASLFLSLSFFRSHSHPPLQTSPLTAKMKLFSYCENVIRLIKQKFSTTVILWTWMNISIWELFGIDLLMPENTLICNKQQTNKNINWTIVNCHILFSLSLLLLCVQF